MRTNIVLNDELVKKAFIVAPMIKTKKDLIDIALKEFIETRNTQRLSELRGLDLFAEDYDYKDMRNK